MIISGVAEQLAERLAHLVYLDAFVPADGQSVYDLAPQFATAGRQQAAETGAGWRVPPLPGGFGVTAAADRAWLLPKLVDQPLATFEQPVRWRNPAALALPRTYILCTAPASFAWAAERLRSEPQWRYRELATGHDAMVTMPEELTTLLLEASTTIGGPSRDRS